MSFDHYGNNLYFCDTEKNTVEVFSMYSKKRIVFYSHGEKPVAITVVPEHG